MKKFFILFFFVILSNHAFSQSIKVGEVLKVPEWGQTTVLNHSQIRNNSGTEFNFKDPCSYRIPGQARVVGVDSTKVKALYSYKGSNFLGQCPDSTMFNIPLSDIKEWKEGPKNNSVW